jgi:hypothetical protein
MVQRLNKQVTGQHSDRKVLVPDRGVSITWIDVVRCAVKVLVRNAWYSNVDNM